MHAQKDLLKKMLTGTTEHIVKQNFTNYLNKTANKEHQTH